MAESVVKYLDTVVYSGNQVGKDFFVGSLIWWWLLTRPQALVLVSGPSQRQLGSITWKEIRQAGQAVERLGFRFTISKGIAASPLRIELANGRQVLGYSTTSVERASGHHGPAILVVLEEASGIEDATWEAADSWGHNRRLSIGNPTKPDGRFIELIRQAERDQHEGVSPHLAVNAIRIPSTDSPHAHLDHSPWGLADRTWLETQYRRYGRDSLWVHSHIDALIPQTSSEALIPEAWLDFAAAAVRGAGAPIAPRLAIDLGEGVGRDSSVVLVRDELGILEVWCSNAHGLAETAAHAARLAEKWGVPPGRCTWDKMGIGRDFKDHLYREGMVGALPYGAASTPRESGGFTNMRSEAAWNLRRRLDPAGTSPRPFHIPPGTFWPRLRQELKTLDYSMQGKRIKLLEKERWQDRLGHSPDIADALIQSFAL